MAKSYLIATPTRCGGCRAAVTLYQGADSHLLVDIDGMGRKTLHSCPPDVALRFVADQALARKQAILARAALTGLVPKSTEG